MNTYYNYITQKIEYRDSLYILYTVKEWGEKEWWTWAVRTDLYKIKPSEVSYYLAGAFYSPDRKKILVWIGEKMPNAISLQNYSSQKNINKICPEGPDTIYNLSALIGIRDNLNQPWKLYPFDQESATCSNSKDHLMIILGQYYFNQMRTHQMESIIQSGNGKGFKELKPIGYNLQDKDFWDKCLLFQKDTVGSYGLYPFQIKGYKNIRGARCVKCAEPFYLPQISYPEKIIQFYKNSEN
jgi:hypothetical protein